MVISRMRVERLRRGLTLAQAGRKIGVSAPFVSLVERAVKPIPLHRAARIAQVLGSSQRELFRRADKKLWAKPDSVGRRRASQDGGE